MPKKSALSPTPLMGDPIDPYTNWMRDEPWMQRREQAQPMRTPIPGFDPAKFVYGENDQEPDAATRAAMGNIPQQAPREIPPMMGQPQAAGPLAAIQGNPAAQAPGFAPRKPAANPLEAGQPGTYSPFGMLDAAGNALHSFTRPLMGLDQNGQAPQSNLEIRGPKGMGPNDGPQLPPGARNPLEAGGDFLSRLAAGKGKMKGLLDDLLGQPQLHYAGDPGGAMIQSGMLNEHFAPQMLSDYKPNTWRLEEDPHHAQAQQHLLGQMIGGMTHDQQLAQAKAIKEAEMSQQERFHKDTTNYQNEHLKLEGRKLTEGLKGEERKMAMQLAVARPDLDAKGISDLAKKTVATEQIMSGSKDAKGTAEAEKKLEEVTSSLTPADYQSAVEAMFPKGTASGEGPTRRYSGGTFDPAKAVEVLRGSAKMRESGTEELAKRMLEQGSPTDIRRGLEKHMIDRLLSLGFRGFSDESLQPGAAGGFKAYKTPTGYRLEHPELGSFEHPVNMKWSIPGITESIAGYGGGGLGDTFPTTSTKTQQQYQEEADALSKLLPQLYKRMGIKGVKK